MNDSSWKNSTILYEFDVFINSSGTRINQTAPGKELNSTYRIGNFGKELIWTVYSLTVLQAILSLLCATTIIKIISKNIKLATLVNWIVMSEAILNILPGSVMPILILLYDIFNNHYLCALQSSIMAFAFLTIQYVFVAIGIVRWLVICMKFEIRTKKLNLCYIMTPGLLIGLISGIERFLAQDSAFCISKSQIVLRNEGNFTSAFTVFVLFYTVLNILLNFLMSSHITYTLWKHRLQIHPDILAARQRKQGRKIEVVTTFSQLLHLIISSLTFLPLPLVLYHIQKYVTNDILNCIAILFSFLGTIVDPIIYLIFSKEFKKSLKEYLRQVFNN